MTNKKYNHTLSDKYSIVMYLLLMIMSTIMLVDNSFMEIVQQQFIFLYKVMVAMLLFVNTLCFISALLARYVLERTLLCFFISVSMLLLIEKTIVFCLYSPIHSPGDYILYISMTLFKAVFSIYRYLRTRTKIKEQEMHAEAVKAYSETIKGGDTDEQ